MYRIQSHAIAAALAIAGFAASLQPAAAQTVVAPETATLTVVGKGRAVARPDHAMLTTGVMTSGKTADEALKANSAAMEIVVGVIKASGVESRDIGTSGFSIQPQYSYPAQGSREPTRIVGYEVRNGVTVKVRDLATLGGLLDRVVQSGANQASGLSFLTSESEALEEQARLAAAKDAMSQAAKLADTTGVQLTRIRSIQPGLESGGSPPIAMMMAEPAGIARKVPVEAGETEARATMTFVYEIAPR